LAAAHLAGIRAKIAVLRNLETILAGAMEQLFLGASAFLSGARSARLSAYPLELSGLAEGGVQRHHFLLSLTNPEVTG
jgi:hypothetical protein